MRIGAIPTLKRKDLKEIKELQIYQITAYGGSKEEYTTFCTPEARKAIEDYLALRTRHGEKNMLPNTPVFRQQWNLDDELQAANPKPIEVKSIQRLLYKLLIKSGLRERKAMIEGQTHGHIRHEVHAGHGFRKYFNTVLKNADDIKPLFVELWLGHKIGLENSYFRPSLNDLLREYSKCINLLTIDPAYRLAKELEQVKAASAPKGMISDLMLQNQAKIKVRLAEIEKEKTKLLNRAQTLTNCIAGLNERR